VSGTNNRIVVTRSMPIVRLLIVLVALVAPTLSQQRPPTVAPATPVYAVAAGAPQPVQPVAQPVAAVVPTAIAAGAAGAAGAPQPLPVQGAAVAPGTPVLPQQPPIPVQPVQYAQPTQPVQPVQYAQPAQPVQQYAQPVAPAQPVRQPIAPPAPAQPVHQAAGTPQAAAAAAALPTVAAGPPSSGDGYGNDAGLPTVPQSTAQIDAVKKTTITSTAHYLHGEVLDMQWVGKDKNVVLILTEDAILHRSPDYGKTFDDQMVKIQLVASQHQKSITGVRYMIGKKEHENDYEYSYQPPQYKLTFIYSFPSFLSF
jgi:outer membrane biosynthesis protein TonB